MLFSRIRYADPGVSAQVWEETTKADGTITIDPLPAAGTLVIEELEAPPGFEIGEVSSQFVTVEKGEHKQVDVSNDKYAQLIVWKKDAVSGQLLQGATFKATCISNGIAKTAESGPAGFVLDGTIHRIELKPGENHQFTIKNRSAPILTLHKIDEQTLEGIKGVTLRFSKDGEHRDVTTGSGGIIKEALEPGWIMPSKTFTISSCRFLPLLPVLRPASA